MARAKPQSELSRGAKSKQAQSMASRSEARPPSVTPCESCPLRQLSSFRPFEAEELAFVKSLKSGELVAEAGTTILLDGSNSPHLFTVLSGWAVRYKLLAEGRRQVLNFSMPGDLLGLQASLFKEMQHSVDALTDVRLCVFPRQRIWELFKNYPGLAFDMTWLASREESILAEHLASVGQRSAYGRIAYMILHLFDRARRSGLARGNKLTLPVTQQDLADAMGLSIVHTNKTLKRLRATGWITWTRQDLTVRDESRLRDLAEYESVDKAPRPFI
jgi:CRP/FNR family transcriptional regulator, anaerobic regulatory protein